MLMGGFEGNNRYQYNPLLVNYENYKADSLVQQQQSWQECQVTFVKWFVKLQNLVS
jgi:hypothetical protein